MCFIFIKARVIRSCLFRSPSFNSFHNKLLNKLSYIFFAFIFWCKRIISLMYLKQLNIFFSLNSIGYFFLFAKSWIVGCIYLWILIGHISVLKTKQKILKTTKHKANEIMGMRYNFKKIYIFCITRFVLIKISIIFKNINQMSFLLLLTPFTKIFPNILIYNKTIK